MNEKELTNQMARQGARSLLKILEEHNIVYLTNDKNIKEALVKLYQAGAVDFWKQQLKELNKSIE